MKNFTLIISIVFLATSASMAQSKNNTNAQPDTLVWSIYIGGKSDMSRRPFEEKVAENWGIKMFYYFGDCTGTYDYKRDEFEESNKPTFNYLEEKYGKDWRTEFNSQVDLLMENKKIK